MALICKNIINISSKEMFVRSVSNFKNDNFKNNLREKIIDFVASIFSLSENNVNQIFDEFNSIST